MQLSRSIKTLIKPERKRNESEKKQYCLVLLVFGMSSFFYYFFGMNLGKKCVLYFGINCPEVSL